MQFNKRAKGLKKVLPTTKTNEGGTSYDLGKFSKDDIKRLNLYLNTASLMLADDTFYTTVDEDIIRVVDNIKEVVELDKKQNDKFVLQLAAYLRQKKLLRRTPQLLLATASLNGNYSSEDLADYTQKSIGRVDDPAELVSIYNYFGANGLADGVLIPTPVRDGIAKALLGFSEYQLSKYELSKRQVRLIDVMRLCRKQLIGKSLTVDAMFNYLNGKRRNRKFYVGDLSLIAARKKLFENKKYNTSLKSLVAAACVTWEQMLSHFGNTKEVWGDLLGLKLIPGMAFVRNIRNMLSAGVPAQVLCEYATIVSVDKIYAHHITGAYGAIADDYALSAYTYLRDKEGSDRLNGDIVASVLDVLFERVAKESDISGISVVLPDLSASMQSSIGGAKSKLSLASAAVALGLLCAQKSRVIVPWATSAKLVRVLPNNYMRQFNTVIGTDVGCGTELHKAIDYLIQGNVYTDRIIVLSDMQVWADSCYDSRYDGKTKSVGARALERYRKVINVNTWLHSVDISSYGSGQQFDPNDGKVSLMSGFSNDLLPMIEKVESGEKAGKKSYETLLAEIRSM
jgi:60 kDa SS-A/Ro ribonucleoprotein